MSGEFSDEQVDLAIRNHERRIVKLEEVRLSAELLERLEAFTPCAECGVVFKDRDAYGAHLCAGTQGR